MMEVNLTSAGAWRQPVHELSAGGPLRVRVTLPDGVRPRKARLLVSAQSAALKTGKGWVRFQLASILDHEVASSSHFGPGRKLCRKHCRELCQKVRQIPKQSTKFPTKFPTKVADAVILRTAAKRLLSIDIQWHRSMFFA